jgi:KDO2-lipid IV(A) lauroyltransferase
MLSDLVFPLLYYLLRIRRETVFANLRHSFPDKHPDEIKHLAKTFYRNYTDLVFEMIKTYTISKEELIKHVQIANPQVLKEFLDAGQPVILMLAHQGNFEWSVMVGGIQSNYPIDAIYKPLHNVSVDRLLLNARSRFGATLIPAKNTIMEILRRKNTVRSVALVADQTPRSTDEKYWTRFLNQDTAFFLGVEKIARLTKYPVVFMGVKRVRRGAYEAYLKILSTQPHTCSPYELTERYARELERQILENPPDWFWAHRRWKLKKPLYS